MPEINLDDQNQIVTASIGDLRSMIEEAVQKRVPVKVDRTQLNALLPDGGEALNKVTAQKAKIKQTFEFFRALDDNDRMKLREITASYNPEYVAVLAPQVEGTNSAGGFLVPPEFYADVLFLLNQYGFARQYCSQIQMRTNVLNVSTLTGKPTVQWTDENTTITASKGTFGRLTLTAKKLAAIYPISNELLADANIDVYRTILAIFVEVFSQEEDIQVFRGDGTPFTGILNVANTTEVYQGGASNSGLLGYDEITLDDLTNLIQALPPAQQRGATIFIDQNVLTVLLKLKDSQGRYLLDHDFSSKTPTVDGANGLDATGRWSFRGYPVVSMPSGILIEEYDAADHADTPHVIFGNLQSAGCWLGMHGGMEARISHDATADSVNAFTNDLQLLRMTERIAFGVGQPSYIAILKTAAS
jgi:HK97 family phage major capsid protein